MSCLFHSLGQLLNIPTDNVRQAICDYLEANQPILDGMSTHDILAMDRPDYVQQMRQAHVWGGAIEIQAATNLWKARILVDNRRDAPRSEIEFLPLGPTHETTLRMVWTGGHYEPIASEQP